MHLITLKDTHITHTHARLRAIVLLWTRDRLVERATSNSFASNIPGVFTLFTTGECVSSVSIHPIVSRIKTLYKYRLKPQA